MDLAAQLGTTASGLSRGMTERELGDWTLYAKRRMLPQRRLELYLAQIAMMVGVCMSGRKDAKLSDYLFDPPEDDHGDDEEPDADEVRAAFGFNPVKKH